MKALYWTISRLERAWTIYKYLRLDKMDCCVAIIKNARSNKMGKKDIIKVECPIDELDLDVLGFIDHHITVNIIRDGEIVDKKELTLPKKLVNIISLQEPALHHLDRTGSGSGLPACR